MKVSLDKITLGITDVENPTRQPPHPSPAHRRRKEG